MGSLAVLDDDAEFPTQLSDLDVAIAVDTAVLPPDRHRYPHGKFSLFRGCLVQSIFVPIDVLGDREKLLTMLGLGCNLRNARILSDPDGVLDAARQAVAKEWAGQPWLTRRTERSIRLAEDVLANLSGANSPLQQLGALTDLVSQLGGLVAIACAVTPTHRRSIALAAELLAPRGRRDLYDGMIAALGAQDADSASVEVATTDVLAALEIELRCTGRSPDATAEAQAVLPAFVPAGIRQIVDDGLPGAAMLPVLGAVWLSAMLAGPQCAAHDRDRLEQLTSRALQRAGVPPQSWEERCAQLRELTADVIAFCRSTAAG